MFFLVPIKYQLKIVLIQSKWKNIIQFHPIKGKIKIKLFYK